MPIVISRETGAVKDAYTYTQEQLDKAWEQVARAWAAANKDVLRRLVDEFFLPCRHPGKTGPRRAESRYQGV